MNRNEKGLGRDEVLEAFLLECDHGKATLTRYLKNYPDYSGDLIDLSRELSRVHQTEDVPLTPAEQSRIDAAWIAHKAAKPHGHSSVKDNSDPLTSMAPSTSKAIAQELGVPRQVITCFRERKVEPKSVPLTVLRLFATKLDIASQQLVSLLEQPSGLVAARSFKSDTKPKSSGKKMFEEILIEANVSKDDRARLLAEER